MSSLFNIYSVLFFFYNSKMSSFLEDCHLYIHKKSYPFSQFNDGFDPSRPSTDEVNPHFNFIDKW